MDKYIESRDNRIIKECIKLTQKKHRDRENKYLIEGANLVREAISEDVNMYALLIKDGAGYTDIMELDPYVIEPKLFDSIAQTETSQGILAIVVKPNTSLKDIADINSEEANFIVMDRLQDPGNIGTIIRTAEGAGYKAVITVKGTGDVYSPKVVRASAGSVFRIPIVSVEDGRELCEFVKSLGKKLAVTCLSNDSYYFNEKISKGVALVIGNEGGGCDPDLIQNADIKVMIPMKGKLESLNASVAAGILMYEAMRQ